MSDTNTTPLYEQELTPYQYFEEVKSRKAKITDEELLRIYDNCLELIEKAKKTGQKNQIKRCLFHLDTIEKERELIKQLNIIFLPHPS